MERFRAAARRLFRANLRLVAAFAISSPLMDILGAVAIALLLLMGRDQINKHVFTAGTFLAFIVAVFKLYDPVRKFALFNNNFQQAVGASSEIYSIYDYFGSSISVPGYGFPMNDRGSFFNLDASSPDVIAPHKRPFMTIIPGFVMKDGQPLLSFGNMGGDEQAQAQATEIVNMVDLGMNVQAAGDAARFHHSQDLDQVDLESNLYALVGPELSAMGYKRQACRR